MKRKKRTNMSVVERIPSAISYQIELDRQARIRYEKEKQEEKEAKRLSDNSVRTNANRLTKELIRLINAGSDNLRVVLPFRGSPECRRIAEILAKRFKKKDTVGLDTTLTHVIQII